MYLSSIAHNTVSISPSFFYMCVFIWSDRCVIIWSAMLKQFNHLCLLFLKVRLHMSQLYSTAHGSVFLLGFCNWSNEIWFSKFVQRMSPGVPFSPIQKCCCRLSFTLCGKIFMAMAKSDLTSALLL